MAETENANGNEGSSEREWSLDDYLDFARGHGQTSDTRQWINDLEDMLRIAWDLMTPEQRAAFRQHADILALAEAAGQPLIAQPDVSAEDDGP